MKKIFALWECAAQAHSHDVDHADELNLTCLHLPAKGRSLILTCDTEVAAARRHVAKAQTLDHI